jgi:hypothetical protein
VRGAVAQDFYGYFRRLFKRKACFIGLYGYLGRHLPADSIGELLPSGGEARHSKRYVFIERSRRSQLRFRSGIGPESEVHLPVHWHYSFAALSSLFAQPCMPHRVCRTALNTAIFSRWFLYLLRATRARACAQCFHIYSACNVTRIHLCAQSTPSCSPFVKVRLRASYSLCSRRSPRLPCAHCGQVVNAISDAPPRLWTSSGRW